jgi:hypothetical protein
MQDSFDSVSGDPVNHQQSPYGDNWPLRVPTHQYGVVRQLSTARIKVRV